jgi:hypothetical protein
MGLLNEIEILKGKPLKDYIDKEIKRFKLQEEDKYYN